MSVHNVDGGYMTEFEVRGVKCTLKLGRTVFEKSPITIMRVLEVELSSLLEDFAQFIASTKEDE